MFWGTFTNKVDAKGRVSVPAAFRQELENEEFHGLFCYPSLIGPSIEAAGPKYFNELLQLIRQRNPYDELRLAYEEAIIGDSLQLAFDTEGRITIPSIFSKYADIDDQITFVGTGDKIMMWNPIVYEEHHIRQRQLAADKRQLLHDYRTPGQPPEDGSEK